MKDMKKVSLTYYLLFGAFLCSVLLGSCKKQLDDAYTNPNSPASEPIDEIFPSLIGSIIGSSAAAGSGYGLGGDATYLGRYCQYWGNYTPTTSTNGGTQFDEMGGVKSTSDAGGSVWAAFYYGMGQNLNMVVAWGSAQKAWHYVGAARALRAWGWLELTDEYANAIIVKEAFNTSRSTFDYDSSQVAFDSCRVACKDAINYLSMTDTVSDLSTGDAYFLGGDVSKWKMFTYGILARSYAYLSNTSEYSSNNYPDSVIKYASLAMTTNSGNAMCKFAGTGVSGTSNYFGPYRGNMGSLRQGAYIANLMSGRNTQAFSGVTDPRLWYMLRENPDSSFYGVSPGVALANSSVYGPENFWGNSFSSTTSPSTDQGRYLFRDTAEFPIMTASEMKFLLSEAYYKKGDMSDALSTYTQGIKLDFDLLATVYAYNVPGTHVITDSSESAYLTSVVPTSSSSLTLSQIMLQKYIALFGWGNQETWMDMRRYHYTDADPSTGNQVYANFVPGGGLLYTDNGGSYVYRIRPRYNSEYLYDIPSLLSVGAVDASGSQVLNYHTLKAWYD